MRRCADMLVIAIEIGGTFTDMVLVDSKSGRLTVTNSPSRQTPRHLGPRSLPAPRGFRAPVRRLPLGRLGYAGADLRGGRRHAVGDLRHRG